MNLNKKLYDFMLENQVLHPSITQLQKLILMRMDNLNVAFPGSFCDLLWRDEKLNDVVLFGDNIWALKGLNLWPKESQFRLWVLSSAMKVFLLDFYNLDVGLIPRELILPVKNTKTIDLNEPIHFVYASSYSKAKNIDIFLLCLEFLAEFLKLGDIYLFGHSNNFINMSRIQKRFESKLRIKNMGNHGDKWPQALPLNTICFNLSSNIFEDFSMSVAEAQAAGLPVIVSDLGAHKDISQGSFIKIPALLCPKHWENENPIEVSRRLAEFILLNINNLNSTHFPKSNSLNIPKKYQYRELFKNVTEVNKKLKKDDFNLYQSSDYDLNNQIVKKILHYFICKENSLIKEIPN